MAVNSLLVGLATVLATLLVAYPVAIYLTRCRPWERTIISVACLLPIFVNLIVGILGWYILLLPFGVVQQALTALGLIDGPLRLLRSFPDEASLIAHIPRGSVEEFLPVAQGRMKKKILGAAEALAGGVARVVLGDARVAEPVSRALAGEGTVIE